MKTDTHSLRRITYLTQALTELWDRQTARQGPQKYSDLLDIHHADSGKCDNCSTPNIGDIPNTHVYPRPWVGLKSSRVGTRLSNSFPYGAASNGRQKRRQSLNTADWSRLWLGLSSRLHQRSLRGHNVSAWCERICHASLCMSWTSERQACRR